MESGRSEHGAYNDSVAFAVRLRRFAAESHLRHARHLSRTVRTSSISRFEPAGDQPEAIAKLVEGLQRRPVVPDAARRHRLGQDLHDGQRHRADRPAGARARAEQDARGAALLRVPRVLPEQRGRVLRLATTTTTSPRRTSRRATSTSRRTARSTSTSSRCGCRRPRRSSSGRDCVIVATVSAIYGIGDPSEYHSMILHLRAGRHAHAARRDQAADRDAVHAQRRRLPARHVPRARRRARHLPGRARRERGPRLAVRRRDRVAAALRSADRAHQAEASRASRCSRRRTT